MSNFDFGSSFISNISKNTVESIFLEREQYIIIALTGKVGAGCSSVANFLERSYDSFELSRACPGSSGYSSDEDRENSVLLRYYREKKLKFHVIRARDVITSFLLEGEAYTRIESEIWNKIQKSFQTQVEHLKDDEYPSRLLTNLKDSNSWEQTREELVKANIELSQQNAVVINNEYTDYDIYTYITKILPILSSCLRNTLGDEYTFEFQHFGNELRFFGTLDTKNYAVNLTKARNFNSTAYEIKGTMYTIAERINRMIKRLRHSGNKTEKIAVVIDSMKNKYESNYLRDRYSAYYLFAVSRDEDTRIQHLISNTKKTLSRDKIDTIDYNERPGVPAKKMKVFSKFFTESLGASIKVNDIIDGETKDKEKKKKLKTYMKTIFEFTSEINKSIRDKNYEYFINCYAPEYKANKIREIKLAIEDADVKDFIINTYFLDVDENNLKIKYRDAGLNLTLCKYFLECMKEPLRIFLYLNGLYSFYLQDVETCIQNADIFLTNNEPDNGPKYHLKSNVYRYVALMMHPGLLTPTPVERCMQIAFTAKANSGCLSRQVGAVVTDRYYNILSIGWNDVPCGQTSCIYRNLIELKQQDDRDAYSDYEWNKDLQFQKYLQQYDFGDSEKIQNILNGLPASFCFKTINGKVTGEKNPMNSRAMHGEEKALLQCDQQRVKGGFLFTTASPCEMCAKNAKEHQIKSIYYIEPYPGISQMHVCNSGEKENRARYVLFEGAIGRAYTQLYTPVLPYKDELSFRGFPDEFERQNNKVKEGWNASAEKELGSLSKNKTIDTKKSLQEVTERVTECIGRLFRK